MIALLTTRLVRSASFLLYVACLIATQRPSLAQETSKPEPVRTTEASLSFSFERTPWREVIKWVADQCELALQYEDLPTGSFSYSDPKSYGQQEAIERVNLFLLPQGFTLVRSGKLLSVINLADPRSKQQLNAIAELITVAQIEGRGDHDVVKCIFPLGEFESEDALAELAPLGLMTPPFVFSKTKQIMVTDTVAKLKSVKAILDGFQSKELNNGTVMKSFALKHAHAEDILVVARPHLGLATDEMIGIDVSLSSDLKGEHIFVTGVEDRVKLVENLVKDLDQPKDDLNTAGNKSVLQAHFVEGGNLQTIYSVLQTLLADKSLRLSVDERARSIVALAAPEVQLEIAKTVAELQASEAEFEVIPLKTIDPHYAIGLLEQMLEKNRSSSSSSSPWSSSWSSSSRSSARTDEAPLIDADPGNMRLFVRGKRYQIEQIKEIISKLESNTIPNADRSENMRVLPLRANSVERALKTVAKFWQKANPIVLLPSQDDSGFEVIERVVGTETPNAKLVSAITLTRDSDASDARYLTKNNTSQSPMIRCQITQRGLLIQSTDTEALDQFEQELKLVSGTLDSTPSPPVIFYLQYMKPTDAMRMLAELLDGGEAAMEAEAGTLVNGIVSGSGSFLGSIVTSRDGTATMMSGSTTVVADSRLNRLIAQGMPSDIKRIEDYLKIIDKDTSIAENKTYGSAKVIELMNTHASDVAATLREAYAGRVSASASSSSPTPSGTQQARDAVSGKTTEEGKGDEKKAPAKPTSNQPVQDLEPKMTIAVHESSNSLIVTAPDQLFAEVEALAKAIDTRSQQSVEVVSSTNAALLKSVFGGATKSSAKGAPSGISSNDAARNAVLDMLKRVK